MRCASVTNTRIFHSKLSQLNIVLAKRQQQNNRDDDDGDGEEVLQKKNDAAQVRIL